MFIMFYLSKNMKDNRLNHLVTLGSMLVKHRVGKPVLEDRPRSEATTSTSSTSSTTLATTQESVAYSAVVSKARGSLQQPPNQPLSQPFTDCQTRTVLHRILLVSLKSVISLCESRENISVFSC